MALAKNSICAALALASVLAAFPSQAADAITKEIMARCQSLVGEYGPAMVKHCVDGDRKAYADLLGYPKHHRKIVDRCMYLAKDHGYVLVKHCTDQDIEAEKALQGY